MKNISPHVSALYTRYDEGKTHKVKLKRALPVNIEGEEADKCITVKQQKIANFTFSEQRTTLKRLLYLPPRSRSFQVPDRATRTHDDRRDIDRWLR
jgi:hypothetical protein